MNSPPSLSISAPLVSFLPSGLSIECVAEETSAWLLHVTSVGRSRVKVVKWGVEGGGEGVPRIEGLRIEFHKRSETPSGLGTMLQSQFVCARALHMSAREVPGNADSLATDASDSLLGVVDL